MSMLLNVAYSIKKKYYNATLYVRPGPLLSMEVASSSHTEKSL